MRAKAMALSVLLAATTGAVRADDMPNLSGSWKLVGVSLGRDTKPVPPDHVLTVRQQGPDVTMETVVSGGSPSVTTFTIGSGKATINNGTATKARVEKRSIIVEEKPAPRGKLSEDFFGRTPRQERQSGDLSGVRRTIPAAWIPVDPVFKSTYRVSDDGQTLDVAKPGDLRWRFKRSPQMEESLRP